MRGGRRLSGRKGATAVFGEGVNVNGAEEDCRSGVSRVVVAVDSAESGGGKQAEQDVEGWWVVDGVGAC